MTRPREIWLLRLFNCAIAACSLVVTLPLFLLATILVKLSSRGSVFFVQERIGLDGALFKIDKFRTMRQASGGDEWAQEQTAPGSSASAPTWKAVLRWKG